VGAKQATAALSVDEDGENVPQATEFLAMPYTDSDIIT